ncbi:hypothetical protein Tcan_14548 [Toxocara canis]|uniref:DM domain-containing protein n=1 Tax=Toxocara canis TaxID=6265 RepID=A0A0B2UXY2_TOXCA|nr:hypothetical protein Tcan_14548 [Toxocara canis]
MTNCNTSEAKSEESSLTICASPTASFADESSATTRDQAWRSRVLYCRKCDGHGKQVALKGHAPKCPYNLCECQSCSKLMTKRLHSFKKRNKSRLEAAAILTAQKKAQLAALECRRHALPLQSPAATRQRKSEQRLCDLQCRRHALPLQSPAATRQRKSEQRLCDLRSFSTLLKIVASYRSRLLAECPFVDSFVYLI